MKKVRGSVSIYLCIILLSVIMLISILAERARVSTIQAKCKGITYMATESVLAGYGRQIFEDYGLLLAWENISVEESLKEYMQANINKADLKGTGTNFMDTTMVDIADCNVNYVTTDGGKIFLEQIKKYIKYAGMLESAKSLLNTFDNYTEDHDTENKEEENITLIADKKSDKLLSIVEKINKRLENLKNVKVFTDKYADFKQDKIKNYKEIKTILENNEKIVDELIKLIEDYKKERDLFLRENGYTHSISDYMENNLGILEKIKDNINIVKELDVSKNSEENSQKLNEISFYVKDILNDINKLRLNVTTEEDQKNVSIFDTAKKMINKGVVALVTEDTKNISQNAISTTNLPSNLEENSNGNLLDKAMLLVYGNNKFGSFLNTRKDTALEYELEYLIGGKSNDSDNLAATIKQIISVRNVINLGILMTDSQKMQEVTAIATSVAAVTGLPFMEIVAQAMLIEAWALAESIYEVKILLKDEFIPVVKSKNDWNTDLENMLKQPESSNAKDGLNYVEYCNILLMMQPISKITYRMMDLIQENVQLKYNPNFLMEKSFVGMEVKAEFQVRPLFMVMPWTLSMNNNKDTYKYQISKENSY